MKVFEKITIALIVIVLIASFFIYGMWEDKMAFLAALIPLLYIALALWCAGSLAHGIFGRVQKAGDRPQTTEDEIQSSKIRGEAGQRQARGQDGNEVETLKSGRNVPFSVVRHPPSGIIIPPGGLMLLLFWLYSAVMVPFSVIPYEAKISTLRFGCYAGVYWATANMLSRFTRRKTVWVILLTALLAVALYSLVQHKISPETLFGLERYTSYWKSGRLGGTYQCPNHIAHLFQMWVPLCLVALFIPQFGWFWRICFGYAVPVFSLLIYQTKSRASLLGMIAATGILFLMLMLRKSRKAFLVSLIAAPLLMAGGLGGLWAGSAMFRDRMQPVVEVVSEFLAGNVEEAISIDFRPKTWADSLLMIKDRPFFGVGPGNYGLTFPEYRQRHFSNQMETVHPHSEPIELITEYGVIGTVLFLCAVVSICIPLVRLVKTSGRLYHALPAAALLAALAGTFIHGLFDFELRIFPNALMLSVLAGCAVAPIVRQRAERMAQEDKRTDVGNGRTAGGRDRPDKGGTAAKRNTVETDRG